MKQLYRVLRAALVCIGVAVCAARLEAASLGREIGVGFALGVPSGLNARVWLSDDTALDATVGWDQWDAWLKADYLWHNWSVIPENGDLEAPLYYGVGGFAGKVNDDSGFGPQAVIGVDCRLKNAPFEFFVEAGPAIQLSGDTGVFIHAAIGARYRFVP